MFIKFTKQEDMNIAGNMTMTDIVRIFSRLGCNLGISYIIKKLDCDVIPYVAEQLRITGTLVIVYFNIFLLSK